MDPVVLAELHVRQVQGVHLIIMLKGTAATREGSLPSTVPIWARTPAGCVPFYKHGGGQLALAITPERFRRIASGSISLASDRSAIRVFSLLFSSSNCFSLRISVGSRPSYFFFHLKYVAGLVPARRQISSTVMPSVPCFRLHAFCGSETFEALSVLRSSQPGAQGSENSYQRRSSCQWSEQGSRTLSHSTVRPGPRHSLRVHGVPEFTQTRQRHLRTRT